MTPDELRALVVVAAGRLDLSVAALGSPDLDALFRDLLPGGVLSLGPGARATTTTGGVDVTGPGTGPFAGMTVTARFTAASGPPAVSLRATGDRTWTFARSFPVLAGTVFEQLRFDAPTLVIDPAAPVPIPELTAEDGRAVLAFTGTLVTDATDPATAVLAVLFAGADHAVTGQVVMSAPLVLGPRTSRAVPDILLYGPDGRSFDLGLLRIEDLRYDVDASPTVDYARLDLDVATSVSVTGTIPVTVGGAVRRIYVSGDITPGPVPTVLLGVDLDDLPTLGLDALTGLLGHAVTVPFDVPGTATVELAGVRMLVTPTSTPLVRYVTATVRTQEDWVLGGPLTLQEIDLTFRVDDPLTSPKPSAVVSGLVGLGESGTLELVADSATATLGGGLRRGDPPLTLREIWTDLTGTSADHIPADLAVTRFDSFVTLATATTPLLWNATIRSAGDWSISDQVTLTDVEIALAHRGAGPSGTGSRTTFDAMVTFLVGGVAVAATANYDPAPDRKWHFAGTTGPGQAIAVGAWMGSVTTQFGSVPLPAPLAGLTIEDLGVDVSTGTGRLLVTGQTRFPLADTTVATTLALDTGARSLGAQLVVAVPSHDGVVRDLVFDARFATNPTARRFAAAWHHPANQSVPRVKELVAAFSAAAAAFVPDGLAVDLHDVALLVDQSGGATRAVLLADLTAAIDLSQLPVVGEHLTGGTRIGVDPLRIVAASGALTAAQVGTLGPLLPAELAALPPGDLAAGVAIHAVLRLAGLTTPLAAPVGGPVATAPAPATATTATTRDGAVWHQVQRAFGPLTVNRVGLAHRRPPGGSSTLSVLVDASVDLAGIGLSLDGLAVGLALDDPTAIPVFDLAGMGLAYAAGPIEAAGAFGKSTLDYAGTTYVAYGGGVTVRTPQLTLAALGSYAQLPEGPSVFVAAFLDDPIGGPPFFFVRGLAGAFGYNRRLIVPPVAEVATFPLVADAVGGRPADRTIGQDLQRLAAAIPASVGDYFLAAGVHFTSFGMVDSVVMVTVGFGHRFEVDVLGLSTLLLPAPDVGASTATATPLAEVQVALRAALLPDEGSLIAVAQLTNASFVLSRDCHLRGGFAVASWFGGPHAGDFVITAGGYHPRFPVPAHYPSVPRLGFDWQVSPQLAVSGSGYFALTPGMLMAGGSLRAVWSDDALTAWFDLAMDLLIGWQPYHYEADVHVAIGASYRFDSYGNNTISVHLGADVHLWGPDFGGTATLDLSVVSVTIDFGTPRVSAPPAVPWPRLRASVLPALDAILAVAVGGADRHANGAPIDDAPPGATDLGVVDAAGVVLRVTSAVPGTAGTRGATNAALPAPAAVARFGVGPCDRAVGTVASTFHVGLTREGADVADRFTYEPTTAALPAAVWGGARTPDPHGPALVEGLLTGWTIRPLPAGTDGSTTWLGADALVAATAVHTAARVIHLNPPEPVRVGSDGTPTRERQIMDSLARNTTVTVRAAVVAAALPGAVVDLAGFDVTHYTEAPLVVTG